MWKYRDLDYESGGIDGVAPKSWKPKEYLRRELNKVRDYHDEWGYQEPDNSRYHEISTKGDERSYAYDKMYGTLDAGASEMVDTSPCSQRKYYGRLDTSTVERNQIITPRTWTRGNETSSTGLWRNGTPITWQERYEEMLSFAQIDPPNTYSLSQTRHLRDTPASYQPFRDPVVLDPYHEHGAFSSYPSEICEELAPENTWDTGYEVSSVCKNGYGTLATSEEDETPDYLAERNHTPRNWTWRNETSSMNPRRNQTPITWQESYEANESFAQGDEWYPSSPKIYGNLPYSLDSWYSSSASTSYMPSTTVDSDHDDEEDEPFVVEVHLDKALLTKSKLGNTRIPRSRAEKASLAADIANRLNEEIFNSNHAEILNSSKYGAGAKTKLSNEKHFDTVVVAISNDGRDIIISGNVKKRTQWKNRFWHSTEYGLHEAQHKQVIVSVLKEHFPELTTSRIDVIRPKISPTTAAGNAEFHAEQQILSYVGEVSDHPIGVNKPPCQKCSTVLDDVGVVSKGYEGKSLPANKVKNWIEPNPEGVEHNFNVRNKKVTVDHNLHGHNEGLNGFVKGMTTLSKPAQVPRNADISKKITSHAKNHLNINVKPQVGVSTGAGLENIINNITETKGRAHAEIGHASKGSYSTKCSAGVYARASTAEASASWNVFSASANGPAASAGLHAGVGTWAAAYANAEVARAEAVAGPVAIGVGLNANTGASVGLDGVSASLLGFGFSIGPKMSVKTPVADVSCSIM